MRLGDCVSDETYEVLTYFHETHTETVEGREVPTGYVTLHLVVRAPREVDAFRRALTK